MFADFASLLVIMNLLVEKRFTRQQERRNQNNHKMYDAPYAEYANATAYVPTIRVRSRVDSSLRF